jgi:DNA-binding transcriptional regulator YdaS (Cro superfamily)
MTLKQAVRKLGGASKVAAIVGVPRTSVIYWMNSKKPPKWRQAEVAKIIALAGEQQAA